MSQSKPYDRDYSRDLMSEYQADRAPRGSTYYGLVEQFPNGRRFYHTYQNRKVSERWERQWSIVYRINVRFK